MSRTASRPEEPSASWMSARTRPGASVPAALTAWPAVRAMVVTSWPRLSTISARSMRDQRLVLDDQHAGGDLPVDLGDARRRRGRGSPRSLRSVMTRRLLGPEALERGQQQDLPALRRHGGQPLAGGALAAGGASASAGRRRAPGRARARGTAGRARPSRPSLRSKIAGSATIASRQAVTCASPLVCEPVSARA